MPRRFTGALGEMEFSEPELYVNNEARSRSGHMSHAMIEYKPGCVLAFNSNCSPKRNGGHGQYGWIEYRRSLDGGKTFGEICDFPYSKEAFLDGLFTIAVEKAVVCDDGTIVAFCLRNTPYHEICSEPFLSPMYVRSFDEGKTWTEAKELAPYAGRVYDALYYEGAIYAVHFCNDAEIHWTGNKPEHVYRLYKSTDSGNTWEVVSTIPVSTLTRGYGSMLFRPDGSLIFYYYNRSDEVNMDYAISYDKGLTWTEFGKCHLKHGIRNPQTAILDGVYILHGRGAMGRGFFIYTSADGINWDDGFAVEPNKEWCYYSNNIVLKDENGKNRLLIQYSDAYANKCVNVRHAWLKKV